MSLLAWDYFIRPGSKPKIQRWVARRLLMCVLVTGIAPLIPWWLPAGQPPAGILAAIHKNPGLPLILPWGVVLLVAGLLCLKADTRDSLLGHGRVLSLVRLGLLVLVLVPVLLGWSFTDRKSTRLNSSHRCISYAVFCLKKKKERNCKHRSKQQL